MRIKLYFDEKVKYVHLEQETVDEIKGYATKFVILNEPTVALPTWKGYIEVINVRGTVISKREQVQNLLKDEYIFVRLYDIYCPSGDIPVASWLWQDEHKNWNFYQPGDNLAIENSFKNNTGPVKILNGTYECDPVSKNQTRLSTRIKRKMIRGTWFWTHETGSLFPYDENISVELERGYQNYILSGKNGERPVSVGNGRYVHFSTMNQTSETYSSTAQGRKVVRGTNGKTKRHFPKPRKPYIAPNLEGKDYFSNFTDLALLSAFLDLPDLFSLMRTCKRFYKDFSGDRVWQRLYVAVFSLDKIEPSFSYKENYKLQEILCWSYFNCDPEITFKNKLQVVTISEEICAVLSNSPVVGTKISACFKIELESNRKKNMVAGIGIADSTTDIYNFINGKITSLAWSDGFISGLNRERKFQKFSPFKDGDIIEILIDQPSQKVEWKLNGKQIYSWKDSLLNSPLHFIAAVSKGTSITLVPKVSDEKK